MERRFAVAMLSALGVHGALIALTATTSGERTPDRGAPRALQSVEVALLAEDFTVPRSTNLGGSTHAGSERVARIGSTRAAATAPFGASPRSESAGEPAGDALDTGTEGAPVEGSEAASRGAHPRIDLGLDGSLFESAVLDAARRGPPPRARIVHDDWSAVAVRIAVDQSALREGSALITIEWDAEGRLQSIASSGHSSDANRWKQLTDSLQKSLARRPKRSPEGRGLRLVYLVKSEIIQPLNQRSVLPSTQYGSFEQVPQFKDLPPQVTLNFGFKADSSTPGERVVSVALANSQLL